MRRSWVRAPRIRGFTLLELLVVVLILGALASMTIPRFVSGAEGARKNTCAHNKAVIRTQVERWHFAKGTWPATDLSDIGSDPAYFPDGLPICPVDGSPYKLHPTICFVKGHDH